MPKKVIQAINNVCGHAIGARMANGTKPYGIYLFTLYRLSSNRLVFDHTLYQNSILEKN